MAAATSRTAGRFSRLVGAGGGTSLPGVLVDFATGEGEHSCAWGECPHLPAELDVFCSQCRFNFVTMEGNSPCADPLTCEYATAPMSHVENMRDGRDDGRHLKD